METLVRVRVFQLINTIFRTDHYDLSNGPIRSLVRINTVFQRINTIFRTDQYDPSNGSIRPLVRINMAFGSYSTVCVSATSTRNLTFLAQITCDLHEGEKCKVSRAHCYSACASILYCTSMCVDT
jgi:hypothetical protein